MSLRTIIYLCLSLCTAISGKEVRIVGGVDAQIEEFPHTVSLRKIRNNEHFCGGTIITEWHILTAAHCFLGEENSLDRYRAYTGTSSPFDATGPAYRFAYVDIHPKYKPVIDEASSHHNDIAILTTRQKIVFNQFQNKAELPTREIRAGLTAYLTGWGITSITSRDSPSTLQKALMTIIDHDECEKTVPFLIHEEQLCAFQRTGVGSCIGDSGGPLTVGNTVVGISSFNLPCAKGIPDIYTDVYNYLDFILPIIKM